MSADRFCLLCLVSLDLHPWPEDERNPGCEHAERRAQLLEAFGRPERGSS